MPATMDKQQNAVYFRDILSDQINEAIAEDVKARRMEKDAPTDPKDCARIKKGRRKVVSCKVPMNISFLGCLKLFNFVMILTVIEKGNALAARTISDWAPGTKSVLIKESICSGATISIVITGVIALILILRL